MSCLIHGHLQTKAAAFVPDQLVQVQDRLNHRS